MERMQYKLQKYGLYYLNSDKWQKIGGWIQVVARTRLSDKRGGYGVLLEWKNYDGIKLREVIYARDLNGDHARHIRDMLIDTGYPLIPAQPSWSRLLQYLLEQMTNANPAIVVNRTGWHGKVFSTSNWTIGTETEPHYFVGQLSSEPIISEQGKLIDWQQNIGELCRGNPLAIFSIGTALAAPLLARTGMENGAFHFVGSSSVGKTTLLQLAGSVYGGKGFVRSWISTSNGLAAVSSEHNDMLLPLDEIGMARPEDIDTAIYQIMNGAGKLRANVSGDLAKTSHWRTLVLSSGEVWITELLQQLGKQLRAGQQIRVVEIPIFGAHGTFDNLHGRPNSQNFVDELKGSCLRYHGTVIRTWIGLLTEVDDGLDTYLTKEVSRLTSLWVNEKMASQVQRVVRRFALVAVGLCLANRNYILPWTEDESINAVHSVLIAWLNNRGHSRNSEEYLLLKTLGKNLAIWQRTIIPIDKSSNKQVAGYSWLLNDEEVWLISKDVFLKKLNLSTHYMREVQILLQHKLLISNELSRGTYRKKVNTDFKRFFALRPNEVRKQLTELERVKDEN